MAAARKGEIYPQRTKEHEGKLRFASICNNVNDVQLRACRRATRLHKKGFLRDHPRLRTQLEAGEVPSQRNSLARQGGFRSHCTRPASRPLRSVAEAETFSRPRAHGYFS